MAGCLIQVPTVQQRVTRAKESWLIWDNWLGLGRSRHVSKEE